MNITDEELSILRKYSKLSEFRKGKLLGFLDSLYFEQNWSFEDNNDERKCIIYSVNRKTVPTTSKPKD